MSSLSCAQAGAGREQATHDDVLLEAAERLAELDEILVLMESILDGRDDREEELARRSPIPEGWLRIVAKAHHGPEAE